MEFELKRTKRLPESGRSRSKRNNKEESFPPLSRGSRVVYSPCVCEVWAMLRKVTAARDDFRH